jgi:hypothetical protein
MEKESLDMAIWPLFLGPSYCIDCSYLSQWVLLVNLVVLVL